MKFLEALLEAGERADRFVEFQSGAEIHRLSMAELVASARRRAGGLLESLVEPAQVVAVAGTTGRDTVQTILSVWLAGAVPTVLPLPARMGRMEEYSRSTQAKLAACRASLLIGEEAFVESQQQVLNVPCRSFAQLDDGPEVANTTELGLIQFSSGTTREPSPVALEREAMLANVRAMLGRFPGDPSQHSCVSWLPLYHDMGFIGCLLSALVAQGNLTLLRPEEFVARPIAWLEALTRTRATTSPAPNFALALCCERVRDKQMGKLDLSNWSVALIGAEPVQRGTLELFAEKFGAVGFRRQALTPVYGLAEGTLGVTFSPIELEPRFFDVAADRLAETGEVVEGNHSIANLGRPLDEVSVEIRDRQGQVLGENRLGRVWVDSPGLMQGYLYQPERTAEVLVDGWLDTGDLGFLREGELYLYGRAKDILLIQGRNHDPVMVEQALAGVDGLRASRVAAFSVPDAEKGSEALVVVAERQMGKRSHEPAELARQARAAVIAATGLVPSAVHIVEPGTLPVTSSGKIRRSQARLNLTSGSLKPVGTG